MFNLFFFVSIFSLSTINSQINGVCRSAEGKPIPFVNIVAKGKNYGTVTDEKGNFIINNEIIIEGDALIFSHIRFNPKEVILDGGDISVSLTERHVDLEEIIITNTPYKIKEVGTLKKRKEIALFSNTDVLGSEIGKLIKVKPERKYELLMCFFVVSRLDFKEAKLRINFYNVSENRDFENPPINKKEIITTIKQPGNVAVDLNGLDLIFDNDFLVSLEWIEYSSKKNSKLPVIEYASNVFNGPFFFRENIESPWQRQKLKYNVGLGISLLVKSYYNK